MAPQKTEVATPNIDALDISSLPKPFKLTSWKVPARRNKNLKQILQEAQRAQASQTQASASLSETAAVVNGATLNSTTSSSSAAAAAAAAAIATAGTTSVGATYTNIEAAVSFHPGRLALCDITGLPASYTDPKTKLRYVNKEVYQAIRSLPPGAAEGYLELRGANVVLK